MSSLYLDFPGIQESHKDAHSTFSSNVDVLRTVIKRHAFYFVFFFMVLKTSNLYD